MIKRQENKSFDYRGTSRQERLLPALLPAYAPVDERKLADLLAFISRIAEGINFYNTQNDIHSNWTPFFEKDISIFLARLITFDLDKKRQAIQKIAKQINRSSKEALKDRRILLRKLFYLVLEIPQQINSWYTDSFHLRSITEETRIEQELEKAIETELGEYLRRLLAIDIAAEEIEEFGLPLGGEYEDFHSIWQLKKELREPLLAPEEDEDVIDHFSKEILLTYRKFYYTALYITELAPQLLKESLSHKKDHQPDIALLIAFLQLYGYAQDKINNFTSEHLNHYYRTILEQKERGISPDHTHIAFELSDHVDSYHVKKGTLLLADVNEVGLESHYATDDHLLVSKAKIVALKTIFLSKPPFLGVSSSYRLVSNIYAAEVANSKDGKGLTFETEQNTWPLFGEEQGNKALADKQMAPANVGFMIASPVLLLQEGERWINLKVQLLDSSLSTLQSLLQDISHREESTDEDTFSKIFANALNLSVSGEAGWISIPQYIISPASTLKDGSLQLRMHIPKSQPAIVRNNPEVLGISTNSQWPLLKVELNTENAVYSYSFIKELRVATIEVEVMVEGLKNMDVYNNLGLLDSSAPFQPFGPTPTHKAYFLFGAAELFNKQLTSLDVKIEWQNLPTEGLAEYYAAYNKDIKDDSFQVQLSVLHENEFFPNDENKQTFPLFLPSDQEEETLKPVTHFDQIELEPMAIVPDYNLEVLPEYSNRTRAGFFKFQLSSPAMGFGSQEYPLLFAEAITENARVDSFGFFNRKKKEARPLPREPYIPVIDRLSLNYRASATIDLTNTQSIDTRREEQLFHIHPFGLNTIYEKGYATDANLLPQYEAEGYLFIGLENLKPASPLSILFNLEKSDQRYQNTPIDIKWSYLSNDQWLDFEDQQVLSNSTRQFTQTGIVRLQIPEDISNDNRQLPSGIYWIRISVEGNKEAIGRASKILPHAVKVTWVNNGDESHFDPDEQLPYISDLLQQVPDISSVQQIHNFIPGQARETEEAFYMRTSERLRHKNRGVTTWDIERLVMEAFSDIHQVKCFGHAGNEGFVNPGAIKIVLTPTIVEGEEKPKVGYNVLQAVEEFLQPLLPSFVELEVINPVYEKVVINCDVFFNKFIEGEGLSLQQLHTDLKHFICPWLKRKSLNMGGSILQNDILSFIKDRPYIDLVTGFSILHIIEKDGDYSLVDSAREVTQSTIIQASTPWSVLIPVERHQIRILPKMEFVPAAITTLEKMRLGTEFIIPTPEPNDSIETFLQTYAEEEEDREDEDFFEIIDL